jgi:hypothetical protein
MRPPNPPGRPGLIILAVLALAPTSVHAQDPFGVLEGLFSSVNSIVFYGQGAVLQSDSDVAGSVGDFALAGVGVEVLLDLPAAGDTEFELGLGGSTLNGIRSPVETLDLRGALRTLPTVAVYAAGIGVPDDSPIDPYVGLSVGLAELWNARGYDAQGNVFPVAAETFELGATAGLYIDKPLPGLYIEVGYRHRRFGSLAWTADALPAEWPRSMDASTWQAAIGWQFRLRNGEETE